jgi:hypothetical protein
MRMLRKLDLASQHLLDRIERIHELAQFNDAIVLEPDEVGDEQLDDAAGCALA